MAPKSLLLQSVTPYKSLSFIEQQISISKSIHVHGSHSTVAWILLICALGPYYTGLHVLFYFLPPSQTPLKVLLVDSIWVLGMSESFSLVVAANATLTLYYFIVFYLDVAFYPVHRLLSRLLFHSTEASSFRLPYKLPVIRQVASSHLQMLTWLALNVFQGAILGIDIGIPLIMLQCTSKFLPQLEADSYFDQLLGVATSWTATLFLALIHLFHLFLYPIAFILYPHVLILAFTYCVTFIGYLNYRVQVNIRKLKTALVKRLYWGQLDSVKVDMISILKMLALLDRVFSKLFLAFLLVNIPCSALLATLYLFNHQTIPLIALGGIGLLLTEQLSCTVGLHYWVAHSSKALHRVGSLLLRLNAHNQHRGVGNSRAHLRLDLLVATLHTKRKYGFTYGGLARVTMPTFGKCLLLYVEVLLYAYSFAKY